MATWARHALGHESATDVHERALRLVEEAVELAQVCTVPAPTLHLLIDYVYGRSAGTPDKEVAGTFLTLYAIAVALDIDADAELEKELTRVYLPEVLERVRRRQKEKREALTNTTSEHRPPVEQPEGVEEP